MLLACEHCNTHFISCFLTICSGFSVGIVNEILWATIGEVPVQSFYLAAYDAIRKSTYAVYCQTYTYRFIPTVRIAGVLGPGQDLTLPSTKAFRVFVFFSYVFDI